MYNVWGYVTTTFINPFKASLFHVFESWVDHIAPDTTIFDAMPSMSEWSSPLKQINHKLKSTFKGIIQTLFKDPNCQSLPQTFIMDISINDNNHGIEIESMGSIFQKYDFVSSLTENLMSCFLITSFTNGSAAPRVGVKLYDMIMFPGKELSAS